MAVESIFYSASGISCRGALIWDESSKAPRPLLLAAPNWRGVSKFAIETGQLLATQGYIVFVADMFGEGNGPVGTEKPDDFLRPFLADAAGMRRRIAAALDTLTREADMRAVGDVSRRAAIGFGFGGLNVLDLAFNAERDAFEKEMRQAGARWALLSFGNFGPSDEPSVDQQGIGLDQQTATHHAHTLAHAFIADAFAGKL
jgi:dienelactone hydrolase